MENWCVMENILVKCTTSDENPKIVSFPSGVPQLIQHMELIGKVKGTGKKRKYHLEGNEIKGSTHET